MVSTRNSMGESSRSMSRKRSERSHSKPKSKKNKLIKQTLKKVYEKLTSDSDEQLKRKILENLENLKNVIDGKSVEDKSKSEPKKRRDSSSEKRNSLSDSSDNSDKESDSIYNDVFRLKEFRVKVKKLSYKELVEIAGTENCDLLVRFMNKERTNSDCEIDDCPNQLEEVINQRAEEIETVRTQIEEIPDQIQENQAERIEQLPQLELNIDDSSSSDVLIQEADNTKDPQTEGLESNEVIELDDDEDDEDVGLGEIKAQVSNLIQDLTSELPEDSTAVEYQTKSIADPNEVIVIDDDEDDTAQPVNTTSIQKPSRILVINGQILRELLESGKNVKSICSELGLNLNKQQQQQEQSSSVNEEPIPITPERLETPQASQPEIVDVPESPPTTEETVPENVTSATNLNSNKNSKKAKAKKSKRGQVCVKLVRLPNKKFIIKKITKPVKTRTRFNSKTCLVEPYTAKLLKPPRQNSNEMSTTGTVETESSVAENAQVESIQVDSDSSSNSSASIEVTSTDVPVEGKNSTPPRKDLVYKLMKSGSPSNKSYVMKPSDAKLQLTNQKEQDSSEARSILKVNQKNNPTQEAYVEDQRIESESNLISQVEETRVLSASTTTPPTPTVSNANNNSTPVPQVENIPREKPIRRESLLKVKQFANESLIPNFNPTMSSNPHYVPRNSMGSQYFQPQVNKPIRRNTVHPSIPVQEPGLSGTIAANQRETPSVNSSSRSKMLAELKYRSQLKPWIKESKPEPYYEIRKELLSCASLHADYKCMNLKCAFYTSSAELFNNHLQQHLYSDPLNTILACPYCKFQSSHIHSLIQHINVYHEYDRFMCQYCFYRALDPSNVLIHTKHYHPNLPDIIFELNNKKKFQRLDPKLTYEAMRKYVPPLQCLFCDKKFMIFQTFLHHIELHTTSDFVLACTICNGRISKQTLLQHLKVCYRFWEYQCINCKFGCDDISRMREHLANEHPSSTIVIAQRKLKYDKMEDSGDPTCLTFAKAPLNFNLNNIRNFNNLHKMLLNENNVLKINYANNDQSAENARRTATNFDSSIPCSIIRRPEANSTVTSTPEVYTTAQTSVNINQNAYQCQQSSTNIPMVFIPCIPTTNYVYSSGQQNFAQTQPPILMNGDPHVNSMVQNPNLFNGMNSNHNSINYNTAPEQQVVVPKISNVFSFQNVP